MPDRYSPTDTMMDVILDRMHELGWTQKQLAAELGVTQKHISMVFNGHADPSFPLLDFMLEVLGLDLTVVSRAG